MKKITLLLCLLISAWSYAGSNRTDKTLLKNGKLSVEQTLRKIEKSTILSPTEKSLAAHKSKIKEIRERLVGKKEEKKNDFIGPIHVKSVMDVKKERLDSIIYTDIAGNKVSRQYFIFNEKYIPVQRINSLWDKDLQNWLTQEEYTFEWNDYGYIIMEQVILPIWGEGQKIEYTYNENRLADSKTISTYADGNWLYFEKSTYKYDSQGNIIEEVGQMYNNAWINTVKVAVEYDNNGNGTSLLRYTWDGNQWVNEIKELSSYDTNNRQTLFELYTWAGDKWIGEVKEETAFDDNGNQTLKIDFEWDAESDTFIYTHKLEQEFTDGLIMSQADSYWNKERQDWSGEVYMMDGELGHEVLIHNGKVIFTYNELGKETSQVYSLLIENVWERQLALETSYTTLESGEIETIRKAYRYTTAENREHYIDLIYHYTTAFGEWKKTYVKETHLIDGVWEDLYEEAYVYDEDGYETEAVQWLYENNVKYADITEKTKYDSNHNIIQSLYYAGQGTGADDWLLITQFDYEYDNNVRTRKYRYALTEDGEWLADWGEGTDWDLNVPVADLLVFIGYEDDYKIWATYQFEGNGGTGWNENKSTYYYSPLHPESINDTQKGIISVYPNPTTSILYINSEEDTKATVYNLQGMILKQITGKQIDLSGFATGIYIVEVNGVRIKIVKK